MQLNLENDYLVFDNLETLFLEHIEKPAAVDYDNGRINVWSVEVECPNCLVRQVSERLAGTVRQIFERGKSVTNENIPLTDTIVEIPVANGLTVSEGDTLREKDGEIVVKEWRILAVDHATLRSRMRVACRLIGQ